MLNALIGAVLMMAPSPTDYDLEYRSRPMEAFSTLAACEEVARELNRLHIEAQEDTHYWCFPIEGVEA